MKNVKILSLSLAAVETRKEIDCAAHEQVSRPVMEGAGDLEAALALASRYSLDVWLGEISSWGDLGGGGSGSRAQTQVRCG